MFRIQQTQKNQAAIEFCEMFLSDLNVPRYVFGINEYAKSIANEIDVDGFVDDFTDDDQYLNKPIIKTPDLPSDSLVISVVILAQPLTVLKKLKRKDITFLDYISFEKYSNLNLPKVNFLSECKRDIEENLDKYQWVYDRLYDEESRQTFNKLINFRVHSDLSYLENFKYRPQDQYFEGFLRLNNEEVFVDAGGFKGETTIKFINEVSDYRGVHFFEPEPENFNEAKKELASYDDIYFYQLGLAEEKKTLKLKSGAGTSSKISEDGDLEIAINSIDNIIEEEVSFIKMDIEGAELFALQGAEEHIKNDHPKLAICCYHKPDDFWQIPKYILEIREDYKLYLRHYTEGLTETVMFFIPK